MAAPPKAPAASAASLAIPPPITSPFLDEQGAKIEAKGVSWEGYQRAKLVTPDEVALLKALERQGKSQRAATMATQGETYAKLYINLLRNLQKVDTVQWVLVAIYGMIADPSGLALYHNMHTTSSDDPHGPLLKCLNLQDEFSLLQSLRILSLLISTDPTPLASDKIGPLLTALARLANANASPARDLALQCLGALAGVRSLREPIWKHDSLLSGLIKALKSNPTPQVQYWIISSFWQISYEQFAADGLDKRFDFVALVTDTAKQASKEKVIRVAVATLKNLLYLSPSHNVSSMLVQKVLPFVTSLSSRKWSDDDIVEDITYLKTELKERLEGLTTYDEYASEVESGHLSWTAAHESDDFWKENGPRVGSEANGKTLKQLISLVSSSREPVVLAVAANDIGQYLKYGGDRARKTVNDLGGKVKVMELMSHESADVRYRALIAVQRLMSHAWTD